jgi:hypothetical protein
MRINIGEIELICIFLSPVSSPAVLEVYPGSTMNEMEMEWK